MSYSHLTSDDRVRIATLLDEERSQNYIARRVGVHRSSISRELSRNKQKDRPKPLALPEPPTLLGTDCRHARGSGLAQDKYEAQNTYKQAVSEVRRANRYYDARYAHKRTISMRANVYFATAYHSWERGPNENLNGLVRQYFPKRTDFKTITSYQVKTVETKLNTRPRKRYNYRSPIRQRQYLRRRELLGCVALRDGM
jgi:IS30 family transposase